MPLGSINPEVGVHDFKILLRFLHLKELQIISLGGLPNGGMFDRGPDHEYR